MLCGSGTPRDGPGYGSSRPTAPPTRATFIREADEAVLIGPVEDDAAFSASPYLDYAELRLRVGGQSFGAGRSPCSASSAAGTAAEATT